MIRLFLNETNIDGRKCVRKPNFITVNKNIVHLNLVHLLVGNEENLIGGYQNDLSVEYITLILDCDLNFSRKLER